MLMCNHQNAKEQWLQFRNTIYVQALVFPLSFCEVFHLKKLKASIQILFCWLSLFFIWMYFKLMELYKRTFKELSKGFQTPKPLWSKTGFKKIQTRLKQGLWSRENKNVIYQHWSENTDWFMTLQMQQNVAYFLFVVMCYV